MRTPRPFIVPFVFAASLLVAGVNPQPAAAAELSHIRTTSACLRTVIAAGIERSATFRALVDQIEASDVVVYVSLKMFNEHDIAGEIQFVGAAAGRRYVQVFVSPMPTLNCLAILGHELQHAVEIATTPSVVDTASFARCYAQIGFAVADHSERFDTSNAVESGRRILREALTSARGNDGP